MMMRGLHGPPITTATHTHIYIYTAPLIATMSDIIATSATTRSSSNRSCPRPVSSFRPPFSTSLLLPFLLLVLTHPSINALPLEGRILLVTNEAPAPTKVILSGGMYATLTTADGSFRFADVPAGKEENGKAESVERAKNTCAEEQCMDRKACSMERKLNGAVVSCNFLSNNQKSTRTGTYLLDVLSPEYYFSQVP